jgi:hypothetical protein
LNRRRTAGGKLSVAGRVIAGANDLRVCGDYACSGLCHHRLLQAPGRIEVRERRVLRIDGRRRLRERGAVVAIVELDE